jgi:hypothetical protein
VDWRLNKLASYLVSSNQDIVAMPNTVLLQDWTTISGSNNVVIQSEQGWIDTLHFKSVAFYAEVAAVTDQAGITSLIIQTSPAKVEAFFNKDDYLTQWQFATSPPLGVQIVRSNKWADGDNELPFARYLRWKIIFPNAPTTITFRIWCNFASGREILSDNARGHHSRGRLRPLRFDFEEMRRSSLGSATSRDNTSRTGGPLGGAFDNHSQFEEASPAQTVGPGSEVGKDTHVDTHLDDYWDFHVNSYADSPGGPYVDNHVNVHDDTHYNHSDRMHEWEESHSNPALELETEVLLANVSPAVAASLRVLLARLRTR